MKGQPSTLSLDFGLSFHTLLPGGGVPGTDATTAGQMPPL